MIEAGSPLLSMLASGLLNALFERSVKYGSPLDIRDDRCLIPSGYRSAIDENVRGL